MLYDQHVSSNVETRLLDIVEAADIVFCDVLLMSLGYDLSTSAAASFTRRNLADYLRSQVCLVGVAVGVVMFHS